MQFTTKLGKVDIPNVEVLNAARDIARLDSRRTVPVLMERIRELEHHLRILAAEDSQCAADWVLKKEAARAVIG